MIQLEVHYPPLPTPQTLEEVRECCRRANALAEEFAALQRRPEDNFYRKSVSLMRRINREFDAIFRSKYHSFLKFEYPPDGTVRYSVPDVKEEKR